MALNFDHQRNRIGSSSNNITINTNGGLTLPVGSTGDRPTPAQGMIRYNTTDSRFEAYNGTVWTGLGGVIDTDQNTYIIAESSPGANNNELDFYTNGVKRMQINSSGNLLFGNSLNKFTVNYATGATLIAGKTEVTVNNSSTSTTSGSLVVTGGVGVSENLYVGGNINVTGDVAINGNLTFGDSDADGITINADINSSLVPNASGTNDIGQSGKAWRNIYISKTLTFEGATTENRIVVPANLANALNIRDSSNNDVVVFDTTTDNIRTTFKGIVDINSVRALKLPVGTTSDRPTAEQGMIRYNTSYNLFEAYNGSSWSGLGGVTDLDKNTYIVAETSPGANNNDLDFYTAGVQRLQIDETGAFNFGGASLDKVTIAYATGNTAIKGTLSVDSAATLASAKVSNLTEHRIVIAGAAGALEGNANFRFDSSTFDIGAAGFEKFSVVVSSGNTDINGTLDVAGQTTLATVNILDITSGRVPYATTEGQLTSSSNLTFDGTILTATAAVNIIGDLDVDNININGNAIISTNTNGNINLTPNGSGEVVASSLTVSDLTSTRLVFAGTSGALTDSANLTYSGSALDLSTSVNITGDLDVDNININANSIISTNTDGNINLTPNGTGKVIVSSLKVSDLTTNRVVISDGSGLLIDNANLTFDGTTLTATAAVNITGDLDVDNININGNTIISTDTNGNINLTPNGSGEVIASSLTVSDLTNNRLVIAGTSGSLTDSSNLTYDGTTFTIGSEKFTVVASSGNTETKGNLTVGGNLTVNGSTTTFNSTTITVDDPIFTLGGDVSPTADDNKDRGIEFRYYNGSAKVGFFGYDDSTGYFTFIPDATNTSEVFTGTTGTLDVAGITGNAATATSAAKWTTARTVTFATGDVTGSFTIDGSSDVSNVALTIAENSVALGTDTTGNYVATVAAGTPSTETSSSGLTISAAAGEGTAVTIAHADTSTLSGAQGTAGIAAITVDGFGHITAVTTATYLTTQSTDFKTVTVTDTDSGYTWSTTGSAVGSSVGDTLTIVDGGGIDIDADSASKAIRIQHSDTSSAANLSATSRTYVDGLTFDTYGHVTAYTTSSETVTDTNTTYDISSVTTTGGALLRLTAGGSGSGTDDVKFASGTNVTVAYTDANTITISSIDTDTNTTYSQSAVTTTGGALLRLTAGGSGSGNDDVKFASGNAITVDYTDADTITINHTDTSTVSDLTASGRTYVTALTFDTYGHVTAYSTASETVTDTNTTYDISAVTTSGGALLRLTAGGSGSGTDDVKFAGDGITSIAYTDASTITITSTEVDTLDSVTGRGSSTSNSITVGDIAVNGGDITTDQATFGLVDTNATTVNAFGATTTLNLGYDGTGASTTNISIGATATSTTKTINLGTGGASGSTTTINIGSTNGGTTTVNNDLTVTGNLTVNGTTTTVNSSTVTIDDPIFTLGGDTAPSTDDNKDRGIEFRWHTGSAAKVGFFGYDDSAGRFTFIPDATNTSEVFSGTAGDVAFGGVYASTVTGGNVQIGVTSANTIDTSAGNLTINSFGGTTTIDDATTVTGTLDVTGVINANSTAGATNTTSGALIVDGGVGIAENLYVGNTINTAKGVKFTPISLANAPAYAEGLLWYNSDAKTLELYSASSDFSIFMGEREWVRGRNSSGAIIYKGQPVYATGVHIPGNPVHGHHPTLGLADASDVDKIQVLGLAAHDIADGAHGYVIVRGYLDNLDTSMLMTGQRFHLGFASPGQIVMNAPEYPNYPMDLGICLTQDATTGTVYVQISNHTQERLRVTGTARIDGDLTVGGNLNLLGGGSTLTLANLSVDNNFIYLNSGDTIGEANTIFTGSGLNDAALVGHYIGTTTKHFYVKIDSVGGGTGGKDTFAWSLDNFVTTEASGIDLSTTPVALQSNISVVFQATVGHTLNDKWDGTAAPVNLDIAIIGNRNTGSTGVGYTHIGLFFDVSDEKWKLFKEYDPEPTVSIDTSDASFVLGNLVANAFEGALIGNATTSSYWATARTVTFATGDVTGSFTIDGSTNVSDIELTIAANSVALGTDTTGNYVATIAAGTPGVETSSSGLTISAASGEGTAATIAHADTSTLTGAQGTAGIAAITVDGFGHVTAVTTATYLTAESDTLDSVAARNASTSRAITITNATSSTDTTTGALIVTGGVGIGENLNVNGSIKVDSAYNLSSATSTTTSTSPTPIATFSKTTFGGGKVVIQAYDTITGNRTISEMLIVHDGTTASATEYGIVNTSTAIATYDVDIDSGNIRIIATAASSHSTQYKVVQTLILA